MIAKEVYEPQDVTGIKLDIAENTEYPDDQNYYNINIVLTLSIPDKNNKKKSETIQVYLCATPHEVDDKLIGYRMITEWGTLNQYMELGFELEKMLSRICLAAFGHLKRLKSASKSVRKKRCPKCNKPLVKTETDGYWCTNKCYKTEIALWKALQKTKKIAPFIS